MGDDIVVTLAAGSNEAGLAASGTQTINGVTSSFSESGSGVYTITYTIVESNNDISDSAALPVSITLQDSSGNDGATITSIASGSSPGVDANSPTLSFTSVTPSSGTQVVGDTVVVRVTAGSSETGLTLSTSTINGVTPTFNAVGSGVYDLTYTIVEGNNNIVDASAGVTYSIILNDSNGNPTDTLAATIANGDSPGVDANSPVISSITSDATSGGVLKVGDTVTFTLTPSDTESGATVSGSYNDASLSWSTANGGVTYTATYTVSEGESDLDSALQISSVTITDSAGNSSDTASGSDVAKTVDANSPTSAASYTANTVNDGTSQTVTVTFSEAVTGTPTILLGGEKTVTATGMTDSGDQTVWTYSAGTTWTGDGTVTVTVGTATDAAGNTVNSAPTSNTFTIDNTSPITEITYSPSGPYKSGDSVTITATFSEAVTNSPVPQIIITGSDSLSATDMEQESTTEYTYSHTIGSGDGTATVSMATAQDAQGNTVNATPSSGATFTVDNTGPTSAASYTANTVNDGTSQTVTVTFSEAVTGTPTILLGGEKTVTATGMTDSGDQTVWTYSAGTTWTGDGTVTVTVGTATDAAGNTVNSTPTSNTFTIDNTKPVALFASIVNSDTVMVFFNEEIDTSTVDSSDFVIQDNTVEASSVILSTGREIQLTVGTTLTSEESPSVSIIANSLSDAAGNAIEASSVSPNNERTTVSLPPQPATTSYDLSAESGGSMVPVGDGYDLSSISIADDVVEPKLRFEPTTMDMTRGIATVPKTMTMTASTSSAIIPQAMTITSSGWDGILQMPSATTATYGEGATNLAIKFGASDRSLTFSSPVTITLNSQAGLTPVITEFDGTQGVIPACTVNPPSASDIQSTFPEACYVDDGTDLIIYTLTASTFSSHSSSTSTSTSTSTRSSSSSVSVNNAPSFSSSISKVGSTSTNGDAGFGGILKSGPATDETTRVIDSGETVRLRINLSDEDGLSEINQVAINTNFKKDSKNPSIPYATIYWTTYNDLEIYDKDGIFSDVKVQTMTFDDDMILFVDITFDGFMDTTDLEIKAYDKNMASMIETYEDAWALSPIVQTVYEEPVKEFQDLIRISENVIDYNKSGIAGSGHLKPILISAELGEDCGNKPGMVLVRNSDGKVVQKINFRANSDGEYSGVIGVTKEWVPDDYSIHVEIGQKNITPVHLSVFSEHGSEMLPVSQTTNSDVEEFVAVSSLHETVTNTQSPHLIEINGLVDTLKSGHPVNVKISGNGIEDKFTSMLSSSGEFNSYFEIDSKWNSGDYDISVDYLGDVIFTDVMTVDNQMIGENIVLVGMVEPESSLNSEDSSVYQRIDFAESIVMLLASNANEFEISDSPEPSDEFEPATDFVMKGTINTSESRLPPVVEIRDEQDVVQTLNILTNDDGEFSVPVDILDSWDDGAYTATIMSGEFEISSTTFVVNQISDVEPEILEETSEQTVGEVFISDNVVTPGYFPEVLTVSGNVIIYTGELIDVDISKDSQPIKSLHVIGTNAGFFSVPVHIGNDMEPGQYTISVNYLDESVGTSQFTIHEN